MPNIGCHVQLADGPFAILMKEFGIEPPNLSHKPDDIDIDWFKRFQEMQGIKRKGRSSLHKWTCPMCGLNARMGIKGDPLIRHNPCEQKTGHAVFFVQMDGKSHTIYKDSK
jgi:hypothetical protein